MRQSCCATIIAFDKSQPNIVRLIAFAAAVMGPVFLVQSRSTGAVVSSAAAIAITWALTFIVRFAPNVRFVAFLLVAQLVVLLLIGWLYLGDFATVLNFLGKDVRMTGRTWIWEWADMAIKERPMLGFGYQAYWQPGNWGAEEIWSTTRFYKSQWILASSDYLCYWRRSSPYAAGLPLVCYFRGLKPNRSLPLPCFFSCCSVCP